jgi:uncharacterized protein YkwD
MQAISFNRTLTRALGALALTLAILAQPSMAQNTPFAQVLPSTGSPTASQYFASTGKTVSGDFLSTYQHYGLGQLGYPISDEETEGGTEVQYFERVRMEYHPELASQGYNVLFTRLGVDISQGSQFDSVAPFASTPTRAYIKETSHALADPFLSYWNKNGNVGLFGYPISEAIQQDGMTVQWFERARMEYHPELASQGQAIQLTLLGKIAYSRTPEGAAAAQTAPAGGQAGTAAPQAPKGESGVSLNDMESYLLNAINNQRGANGLPTVQINGALTDLARYRTNDMASRNYFAHVTPDGTDFLGMLSDRGIAYKYAGEILARNNYPVDQAASIAMQSYLNSAPHKAIIMDGRYSQVGVGYALGAEGMSYYAVIFVQK